MCFIGQICLPDIAPYDYRQILPERGWLYFFGSVEEQDCFQVCYYEGKKENLERAKLPEELAENIWEIFHSCTLRFRPVWTLPAWQPAELDSDLNEYEFMGIDDMELIDVYDQLRRRHPGKSIWSSDVWHCWCPGIIWRIIFSCFDGIKIPI